MGRLEPLPQGLLNIRELGSPHSLTLGTELVGLVGLTDLASWLDPGWQSVGGNANVSMQNVWSNMSTVTIVYSHEHSARLISLQCVNCNSHVSEHAIGTFLFVPTAQLAPLEWSVLQFEPAHCLSVSAFKPTVRDNQKGIFVRNRILGRDIRNTRLISSRDKSGKLNGNDRKSSWEFLLTSRDQNSRVNRGRDTESLLYSNHPFSVQTLQMYWEIFMHWCLILSDYMYL